MTSSVPCSVGCEHAHHVLPPPHLDWVWCALPEATSPQRLDLKLCPFFRVQAKPTAGVRADSEKHESAN